MFGFSDEAEAIAFEILGDLQGGKKLEKAIKDCEVNNSTAAKLISLVDLMKDRHCENLNSLYVVLNLYVKFLDAGLIDQSLIFALMEIEFNAKIHINENDRIFPFLLDKGLNLNSNCSWKYLTLLLRIIYGIPRCKKILTSMIREEFNSRIGFVLDHLKNFQLGNNIIEILSNCFPRKYADKPGVVLAPLLWPEEPSKNEMLFESPDYPFRGNHGYVQVINFVWQNYGTQLENALRVNNISYSTGSSGLSNGIKKFKSGKFSKERGHCYVQAIRDCMYLWDGEGLFLEVDRRYLNVVKTLKGCIRINVMDKKAIRSPDREWLKFFQKTKWFQLQSQDKNAYEQFYTNITNFPKISEAQMFLLLDHIDENEEELADLNQEIPNEAPNNNSQLATPDHSDQKIRTDEWDINPLSDLQDTKERLGPTMTPENTDQQDVVVAAESVEQEEQSPLVLAQKKRMIRETSRTLELLKKEYALEQVQNSTVEEVGSNRTGAAERSPSLIITKYGNKQPEGNNIIKMFPDGKTAKSHLPPAGSVNKNIKSIGKKDIKVLDTIFGTPKLHSRKKGKRQRELNNFKHVIDVPSQDIPKMQTRSMKQKKNLPALVEENTLPASAHNNANDSRSDPKKKRRVPQLTSHPSKKVKHRGEIAKDPEPPVTEQSTKLTAAQPILAPIQEEVPPIATNTSLTINNADKEQPILESSTIVPLSNDRTGFNLHGAFTDKLQEQIYSSITLFSNELLRKMTIINKELNNRIIKELSEKYQTLFQDLQTSFQNDTAEMSRFISEIKDMLNLPEGELVQLIRTRKFGS